MKPILPTKFNYTYRVVCIVTGKYYYGVHSTNKLDDRYMGTGKIILKSLKKHGRDAHIKTILSHHETREEATAAERALVTEELLRDPLCMNLQTGGDCDIVFSAETLAKLKKTPEQRAAISERRRGKATFVTAEDRAAQAERVRGEKNGMFGRARTPEWCANHSTKMKILMAGKRVGWPSAVKGRKWFHDPTTKISKMLATAPPTGWLPGRVRGS